MTHDIEKSEGNISFATGWGQHDTRTGSDTSYATITLSEVAKMAKDPPSVPKERGQWFIPSTYTEHDARSHDAQRTHGFFRWLTLDVDENNLALSDIDDVLRDVIGDASRLIYTTRSATENNRKWRVLVPTAKAITGTEFSDTQNAFFDLLENASAGALIPDRTLARPAQLVYLPNRGAFYDVKVYKSKALDLTSDHAIIQHRDDKRAQLAKADAEAKSARDKRAADRKAKAEAGDVSPVDHFNNAHTVCDLLARYGYVQAGSSCNWRSPMQSSGSYATRDYGEYWVTLSGSDADAEIGAPTQGGQRWGDAFDLYRHFEHQGDWTAAVKAYAREEGLNSQRDVSLDDFDEVQAPQPPATQPVSAPHPLAKFLDPRPSNFASTEFVIDGVLAAGMTLLAGGWGAGKTSQLVPLMCRAAWLCRDDDELKPKLRRKVIYITEDIGQVRMILRAMYDNGEFGNRADDLEDYFKVVEAERMQASLIARVADEYTSLTTLNVSETTKQEYDAKPVIVFDTRSAIIHLNDENDNTEAGAVIATLRQGLSGYPTVIVGHLAKALKRADTKDMSGRGAGAWEADVQQVLYLANDEGVRFLDVASPKHRFATKIDGLAFESVGTTIETVDVLGEAVIEDVFYGRPAVVALGGRKESKEAERANRVADERTTLRTAVLEAAQAWRAKPLTRRRLAGRLSKRNTDVYAIIDDLVEENWIVENEIPAKARLNNALTQYLVGLTPEERKRLGDDGVVPKGADTPPDEFLKPEFRCSTKKLALDENMTKTEDERADA